MRFHPLVKEKAMKLRIKGNSFRLRISPSEMARLLQSGRIEETIYFGTAADARLTYALEHRPLAIAITLAYAVQEVTVVVPSPEAKRWAEGQDIGLYAESPTHSGPLEIAIEKDFACLDKDDAANADTFPHPNQGAAC